jgi:ribosomal protein L11 methyltransferase
MDDDGSWSDAWRPWARATRIREALLIRPPWIHAVAEPGDTVISLDPGQGWGHGAHPTSVLVSEVLVDHAPLTGATVLDVGCGSGVLSLVAAACGAAAVEAIDIEPAAVAATLANAGVNGLDPVIVASTTPIARVGGTFDWVLANIGAEQLLGMATRLEAAVAPAGTLVLSGLLIEQVDRVVAAFDDLVEVDRPSLDGWAAPVLRRR